MAGQWARWDRRASVTDGNCRSAILEVIAVDTVVLAEEPQTVTAEKEIAIDQAAFTVAEGKLRAVFAKCVKTICIIARSVADSAFIFTLSPDE